jgi:hypothetical protein
VARHVRAQVVAALSQLTRLEASLVALDYEPGSGSGSVAHALCSGLSMLRSLRVSCRSLCLHVGDLAAVLASCAALEELYWHSAFKAAGRLQLPRQLATLELRANIGCVPHLTLVTNDRAAPTRVILSGFMLSVEGPPLPVRVLSLKGCTSACGLSRLVATPSLCEASIADCSLPWAEGLELGSYLRGLAVAGSGLCSFGDSDLQRLQKCVSMRSLRVAASAASAHSLSACLLGLRRLRSLSLSVGSTECAAALTSLSGLQDLRSLEVQLPVGGLRDLSRSAVLSRLEQALPYTDSSARGTGAERRGLTSDEAFTAFVHGPAPCTADSRL